MTDPWFAHHTQCWACDAAERRRKALAGEDGQLPPGTKVWVTKEP